MLLLSAPSQAQEQLLGSPLLPAKFQFRAKSEVQFFNPNDGNQFWLQQMHINALMAAAFAMGLHPTAPPLITDAYRPAGSYNHDTFGGIDYASQDMSRLNRHLQAQLISKSLGKRHRVLVEEVVDGVALLTIYIGGRISSGPATPGHTFNATHTHIDSSVLYHPVGKDSFFYNRPLLAPKVSDVRRVVEALGVPVDAQAVRARAYSLQASVDFFNAKSNTNFVGDPVVGLVPLHYEYRDAMERNPMAPPPPPYAGYAATHDGASTVANTGGNTGANPGAGPSAGPTSGGHGAGAGPASGSDREHSTAADRRDARELGGGGNGEVGAAGDRGGDVGMEGGNRPIEMRPIEIEGEFRGGRE